MSENDHHIIYSTHYHFHDDDDALQSIENLMLNKTYFNSFF